MNQLINITEKEGKKAVNARELHYHLEIGRDFTTWIKGRIKEYGFIRNQDYALDLPKTGELKNQYFITIDMAKELAMVERSEKGRAMRKYFIEVEKKYKAEQKALPQNFSQALRMLADTEEEKQALENRVAADAPKVDFYNTVTESATVCQMAVAAQVAKLPFGRNVLYQKLREKGVLISGGDRHNLPKQRYIQQGLFSVDENKVNNPSTGEPIVCFTTKVTQKGVSWLTKEFPKHKIEEVANG